MRLWEIWISSRKTGKEANLDLNRVFKHDKIFLYLFFHNRKERHDRTAIVKIQKSRALVQTD